jgi:hypothetical protein
MKETKRSRLDRLFSALDQDRATFVPTWRDCNDYVLPRRGRFFVSDVNKGDRRNQKIIDNTATTAVRTLSAGMMSGVTSPARQWFRLSTPYQDLNEVGNVKDWLYFVTNRMSHIFVKSNLYNGLKIAYKDIGTFGTAALLVEQDIDDVIHVVSMPIGSFYIANDEKGKVCVFGRHFRMTVRQLIEKFGERDSSGKVNLENFSVHVKALYERGDLDAWIDVRHIIQPNSDYSEQKLGAKYKKYMSCYYESGGSSNTNGNYIGSADEDKYLRESGYDLFPVLAPRWEVTGEDVYGTSCPIIDCLGDIKALQLMHKRKSEAIEKMVRPPLTGPTSLMTQKVSILPSDVTYHDVREGQQGLRPIFEVNPKIQELMMDIQDHQTRIRKTCYEDLFLMLANTDRRTITAREIDERHEEKLLALGPVLEQLNQDLLDPLIDITFDIMMKRGDIPKAPKELQGMDMKIEYISIMAQAQKMIGISTLERFMSFAGNIVQASPETADKIDTDQAIDVYADMLSVPPGVVRSDETVAQIRGDRAQAQKAQQQAELLNQTTSAAKNLAQADTSGDNALTRLMEMSNSGSLVPQQ